MKITISIALPRIPPTVRFDLKLEFLACELRKLDTGWQCSQGKGLQDMAQGFHFRFNQAAFKITVACSSLPLPQRDKLCFPLYRVWLGLALTIECARSTTSQSGLKDHSVCVCLFVCEGSFEEAYAM